MTLIPPQTHTRKAAVAFVAAGLLAVAAIAVAVDGHGGDHDRQMRVIPMGGDERSRQVGDDGRDGRRGNDGNVEVDRRGGGDDDDGAVAPAFPNGRRMPGGGGFPGGGAFPGDEGFPTPPTPAAPRSTTTSTTSTTTTTAPAA